MSILSTPPSKWSVNAFKLEKVGSRPESGSKKLQDPDSARGIQCLNQSFNTTVCARLLVSFPERMMYGLHIALPNFSHCMTPAVVVCIMYSTYRAGCILPVRVHLHLPSKQRLPMFQWQQRQTAPERGSRRRSPFCSNKYIFICAILCRQESRETLPLQLPLHSTLQLSLSFYNI